MKIKYIAIVMIMALSMIMMSCKSTEPEPEPAPAPAPGSGTEDVVGNIPEGSILLFMDDEGAAKLIRDMEEGNIPVSVRAMYDQMGARPEVEITDPEVIRDVYNRVGHIIIGVESQESITDNYHYVVFTLQDGTTVGWSFEGTGLLCWGQKNYEVSQSGSLWSLIKEMQDEIMDSYEEETAGQPAGEEKT